jgi:hypothetical protein
MSNRTAVTTKEDEECVLCRFVRFRHQGVEVIGNSVLNRFHQVDFLGDSIEPIGAFDAAGVSRPEAVDGNFPHALNVVHRIAGNPKKKRRAMIGKVKARAIRIPIRRFMTKDNILIPFISFVSRNPRTPINLRSVVPPEGFAIDYRY